MSDERIEVIREALGRATHTADCRAYIVAHPDENNRWDEGLCICGLTAARSALDSLDAENQRLREALEQIAHPQVPVLHTHQEAARWRGARFVEYISIARNALSTQEEE